MARLLADIGGTNARFAWQEAAGAPIGPSVVLPCAAFAGLAEAMDAALVRLGRRAPRQAAIAIATQVDGDAVRMTNRNWSFSRAALRERFDLQGLVVLNDFTALALALPTLAPHELRPLGGGVAVPGAPVALLGAGTGLGVSGLVPDGRGGRVPLAGEGGHVTLAPDNEREWRVMQWLAARHGHASAERALSGPGLVDLALALGEFENRQEPLPITPAQICAAALAGRDRHCEDALRLFCAWLGSVAGNLALTLGARGGVFLAGGILPRLGDWVAHTELRARFEAKGRFRPWLREIPVRVIVAAESPALRGAALALGS